MSDLLDRLTNAQVNLTEAIRIQQGKETVAPVIPPPVIPPAGSRKIATGAWHRYSTMSPWNSNNTAMLLEHNEGNVWLHYGDGREYMLLPGVNASSENLWSRSNPNWFYFVRGNKLMRFDIGQSSAKAQTLMREFPEYAKISGLGESDISPDGDVFVFAGNDREIFTYRLSTDQKSKAFHWQPNLDSLYITNTRVLISSPATGIFAFSHTMDQLLKVTPVSGHMDVCAQDGEEYLVWTNSADDTGPDKTAALKGCRNGVVKVRLSDATQTCLLADHADPSSFGYSVHISGVDNKGWVLVSTYRSRDTTPLVPMANKILKVKLDGSGADILQDLGPGPFNTYSLQPKVSASQDGSRYCYDSGGSVYVGMIP